MKLIRANEEIWEGEVLQEAVADGLTLDQMNLKAGDQFEIPERSQSRWTGELLRIGLIIGASALLGQRVFF